MPSAIKATTAVLALGAKYKVRTGEVQTSEIHVRPVFPQSSGSSYSSQPTGKPIGYNVDKAICFIVHDPKVIASLIDDALEAGANTIGSVTFETSELRKYRDQARLMALKAAKEKAQLLAGGLDAKVGKPLRIDEEADGAYASRYSSQNIVSNVGEDSDEVSGGIALGRVKVNANVKVTFQLE